MRNSKGQFIQGNSGKPKGAKHTVNKEALTRLLNRIKEDFEENYKDLTTNQKIKLLTSFKHFYGAEQVEVYQNSDGIVFNELVNAIRFKSNG